jgi:FtsZ-binding cell division protein ZapB
VPKWKDLLAGGGKTPGDYDVSGSMAEPPSRPESPPGSAVPGAPMTVVGAAWKRFGRDVGLLVIGRGANGHGEEPSTAALTVSHQGRSYRFDGRVSVAAASAATPRRTYRFEFRLPPRVQSWSLDGLLLRWQDTDFEVPLPQSGAGSLAAALAPGDPSSERYVGLMRETEAQPAKLREEVARLRDETEQARRERDEAYRERDRARQERDRVQASLRSIIAELENIERRLAERRTEFDLLVRDLTARRSKLEQLEDDRPAPDGEPPGATTVPPEAGPPAESASDQLTDALSDLHKQLARVHLAATTAVPGAAGEPVDAPLSPGEAPSPAPDPPEVVEPPEALESPEVLEPPPEPPPPEPPETPQVQPLPPAAADHRQPLDDLEGGLEDEEEGEGPLLSLPRLGRRRPEPENWLPRGLHRLAHEDREAAGRALVSLLPAQSIATPRVLRYELIVPKVGIYAVDVDGPNTRIESRERPRPLSRTDAWITGSLEQFGDLVARGNQGLLRRLRRYPVTVDGDQRRVDDLLALAEAPLRLSDLCRVGAQIEVPILLRMLAGTIDPAWTQGYLFSVGFEPTDPPASQCYLRVDDGAPVAATAEPAPQPPDVTIRSSAWALIHLLADRPLAEGESARIAGDGALIELLQGWIRRLEGFPTE